MDRWLDRANEDSGIAVLSPHLDDAVLSCWHVLEARAPVTVVNVFTGSPLPGSPVPWWDRLTAAVDPVARMRERRAEDARALALMGRTAVALDLLEAQYRRAELPVDVVARRLQAVLAPGVLVYAPAALQRHPDHELVRAAALELARAGWRLALYADLPQGIARGWPAWVSGEPEQVGSDVAGDWAEAIARSNLVIDRLVARVWPLGAAERARKLRAVGEYRTQRAGLDRLGFAPLDDARVLAWEVSWEVPQSALGSTGERRGELLVADAGGEALDELA